MTTIFDQTTLFELPIEPFETLGSIEENKQHGLLWQLALKIVTQLKDLFWSRKLKFCSKQDSKTL